MRQMLRATKKTKEGNTMLFNLHTSIMMYDKWWCFHTESFILRNLNSQRNQRVTDKLSSTYTKSYFCLFRLMDFCVAATMPVQFITRRMRGNLHLCFSFVTILKGFALCDEYELPASDLLCKCTLRSYQFNDILA